jgi:type II secretory pathway component PulF
MKLSYRGFDKSGKAVAGTVDAGNADEARQRLRGDGVFATEIDAGGEGTSGGSKQRVLRRGKRLKCLTMFSRQLHGLVASGTPMVQALGAIERQSENLTWRAVVVSIREKVEQGTPLSEAMAAQPHYFNAVCRSLVAAGESAGNMAEMLERLANLTAKQLKLRGAVVGALVYPIVLIFIGIAVLVNMLLFVLPRFTGLFKQLDTPLPPTTKMLVWASEGLRGYWWAVLIAIAMIATGVWAWLHSVSGKRWICTALLKAPKIGKLTRSLMTAQLARLMGVLLESKVQLIDALKLARAAVANVYYIELMTRAEEMVSRGEALSAALSTSDLIVPAVQEAIRTGEQSGQIGLPLLHMADFLDEENEMLVKSLTSLLEPLILVALGAVVGFIALSMFLPLFDLTAAAGGGGGG